MICKFMGLILLSSMFPLRDHVKVRNSSFQKKTSGTTRLKYKKCVEKFENNHPNDSNVKK